MPKTVPEGSPPGPSEELSEEPFDAFVKGAQDSGLTDRDLAGKGLPWADYGIALCLLALAALTRFWHVDQPRAVVFDEYHFGR